MDIKEDPKETVNDNSQIQDSDFDESYSNIIDNLQDISKNT